MNDKAQPLLNEMKAEAERGLATRTTATVGELLDRWLELPAKTSRRRRRETLTTSTGTPVVTHST